MKAFSFTTMTFSDWGIIGHERQKQYLQILLKNGTIAHAYLFEGASHLGKTSLARVFAKTLQCSRRKDHAPVQVPCESCDSCKRSWTTHPDRWELDVGSRQTKEASASDVRNILRSLRLSTLLPTYRIALFLHVDQLSPQAHAALLKTLEEPPKGTVIILTAEESSRLPDTIRSRCQILPLHPLSDALIEQHVRKIAKGKEQDVVAASHFARGRPGIALRLLSEPLKLSAYEEDVRLFLGLWHVHKRWKIVERVSALSKDPPSPLARTLENWIMTARDLLLLSEKRQDTPAHPLVRLREQIHTLAHSYPPFFWFHVLDALSDIQKGLTSQKNIKLLLEYFLLTHHDDSYTLSFASPSPHSDDISSRRSHVSSSVTSDH